jgi:hypothetical protein
MQGVKFRQYGVYWPKTLLRDVGGRLITPDSQIIILSLNDSGDCIVCRFGNYRDSVNTHISNLGLCRARK